MVTKHQNPVPTVDIIIQLPGDRIVLIERRNPPHGWAIPGGFVDYGESLEEAAVREAKEETGLDVNLIRQMRTYSDPSRDPRFHTITTVYVASATGTPIAGDDAGNVDTFPIQDLPDNLAFDHREILDLEASDRLSSQVFVGNHFYLLD